MINFMIAMCFLNIVTQALSVNNSKDKIGRICAILGWSVAMIAYIQLKG